MTDEAMDGLRKRLDARRAAMTPDARAAEDAGHARRAERRRVAQLWWADVQGADPEPQTPMERWALHARAFERLGFHDFFDGPGPIDINTVKASDPSATIYDEPEDLLSVGVATPPDTEIVRVLRGAITAAGLRGRIRLTMTETRREGCPPYQHARLSFLDWSLLPKQGQDAWGRRRYYQPDHFGPSMRLLLGGLVDAFPVEYVDEGLWGLVASILLHEGHVLTPHLLRAMQGEGAGVAVWPAWMRDRGNGKQYDAVSYYDIPVWRGCRIATDDVLATLEQGVVVVWPETSQRVRIRLDRHGGSNLARGAVFGPRLLHVEATKDPLSKRTRQGNLCVFGRGQSQQEPHVPVVEGRETVVILTWVDAGCTVTVMATLGDDGMPLLAWVDGSTT